ncbi:hypothetical protein HDU93_002666 [Gonapodya sp. JEL0774]|nr:hypothetical protein HDU93_002666 [Gonapodya sp. JEL0774]
MHARGTTAGMSMYLMRLSHWYSQLIYVNPEGHLANADPVQSAPDIRSSFGRMGMNDRETVALIGGGHAFGKVHGACPDGPGPDPTEDPTNPWPGMCGSGSLKGKGQNTFTSGFEGPWTDTPTTWSNSYFKYLRDFDWSVITGPGGHKQFTPSQKPGGPVPPNGTMMLTSDVALISDPSYRELVHEYASNITSLEHDFSRAWYKLMVRDMGPVWRCKGPLVPPAQRFQLPLPEPPKKIAKFHKVVPEIEKALFAEVDDALTDTLPSGSSYTGALLIHLASQCASTYRATDYAGGCNGARIRFPPESEWPLNAGLLEVVDKVLAPIKAYHDVTGSGALSYADLIVLAGQVALATAAGKPVLAIHGFRGGRVDVPATSIFESTLKLAPRTYYNNPIVALRDNWAIRGFTVAQGVALAGLPRSPAQQRRIGYSGSYTSDPSVLDGTFFKALLGETWTLTGKTGPMGPEYVAESDPTVFVTEQDLAMVWDVESKAIVQEYASNVHYFLGELFGAWSEVMNADLPHLSE